MFSNKKLGTSNLIFKKMITMFEIHVYNKVVCGNKSHFEVTV